MTKLTNFWLKKRLGNFRLLIMISLIYLIRHSFVKLVIGYNIGQSSHFSD